LYFSELQTAIRRKEKLICLAHNPINLRER
jgi:hypothetical protein